MAENIEVKRSIGEGSFGEVFEVAKGFLLSITYISNLVLYINKICFLWFSVIFVASCSYRCILWVSSCRKQNLSHHIHEMTVYELF